MKFSEAASKYYKEMDIDEKEEKEFKFIFNSKKIDFNKTLDEIGIKNNFKISVLRSTYICGEELIIKSILEKEVNKDVSAEKMSGKKIHVSFFFLNGEKINTSLKDDIMFAEVTMQFCEKYGALTGGNKNIETDKVRFFFNGIEIKSYSYKTLAELGISNDAYILVIIPETFKDEGSNDQNIIEKEKKAEKKSLEKEEKNNIIKNMI